MIDEMRNTVQLGHVLDVLKQMPSECVNEVITSPPYWSLRDYGNETETIWDADENCVHEWSEKIKKGMTGGKCILEGAGKAMTEARYLKDSKHGFCTKCGAWKGQLGLEPTFELYIKHLCDIFDEIKRVLRKDGTCFVNLGDSYSGSGKGIGTDREKCKEVYTDDDIAKTNWNDINIPAKSLVGIPERFSLEMRNRGWILRNKIICWKPNCMPSSAKDRFTVDYEEVFFFTKNNKTQFWVNEKTRQIVSKQPKGTNGIEGEDWEWIPCPRCKPNVGTEQCSVRTSCKRCKGLGKIKRSFWEGSDYWFEQQRIAHKTASLDRVQRKWDGHREPMSAWRGMDIANMCHPNGSNMRCVWKITTKGYAEAHFATYPVKLILPMLKAGCPQYVCSKCGLPRVKIVKSGETLWEQRKKDGEPMRQGTSEEGILATHKLNGKRHAEWKAEHPDTFLGYSDCGCGAEFLPGIVLDPFGGAGTTGVGAKLLKRDYILIEIKEQYKEMAERRIKKSHFSKKSKVVKVESQEKLFYD